MVILPEDFTKLDFKQYTHNVQGVLINIPCETQRPAKNPLKPLKPELPKEKYKRAFDQGLLVEDKEFLLPKHPYIFRQLERLYFTKHVLREGIIFIWVEKEYQFPVIKYFEQQGFFYIENMTWVTMDKTKKRQVDKKRTIHVDEAFDTSESGPIFRKAHKTLLMMRRISDENTANKIRLELRHQRTGDVVFDWKSKCIRLTPADTSNLHAKP